ncbi:universal stress protein [Caulobacter soli]|uniref:universal stress protein n=1 Tax=Caulobacter soli TaxID=2708539 RepID=UPI001FEC6525|nr:universal stress protein [Caulobacter soli]
MLAYDGSIEGRRALREGALLARRCGARVFLLCVVVEGGGVQVAEAAQPGVIHELRQQSQAVFDEGVARLRQMGLDPTAKIISGDPSVEIRKFAQEVSVDLVVVGHRRKSLLERWWSGSSGAYLLDQIGCSLLVGRNTISDEILAAELALPPARRALADAL